MNTNRSNMGAEAQSPKERLVPSDAPNNSFATGTGGDANDFDSPPVSTMTLGNKEIAELDGEKLDGSSADEVHDGAEPDVTAHHKMPGTEE